MFKILPLLVSLVVPSGEPTPKEFEEALLLPKVGHHELRIITPRLNELYLVNTQESPGGWDANQKPPLMLSLRTTPQWWDFLDWGAPRGNAPHKGSSQVTVDGQASSIERVGFRQRALYAEKNIPDLRVGQSIYLLLADSVSEGARVQVVRGLHFLKASTSMPKPCLYVITLPFMSIISVTAPPGLVFKERAGRRKRI
ncbi:MAG: hypothetical protein ACI8T1_000961 [Verrucomicrobiales bacterium]|jgi:hypothetical protein